MLRALDNNMEGYSLNCDSSEGVKAGTSTGGCGPVTFQSYLIGTFGIFNIKQCREDFLVRVALRVYSAGEQCLSLSVLLSVFLLSLWWFLRIVFIFFLRRLKRMKPLPVSKPVAIPKSVSVGSASALQM